MLFGAWSFAPAAEAAMKAVRDPSNFQWYLLPIFALVLCVYRHEPKVKNVYTFPLLRIKIFFAENFYFPFSTPCSTKSCWRAFFPAQVLGQGCIFHSFCPPLLT